MTQANWQRALDSFSHSECECWQVCVLVCPGVDHSHNILFCKYLKVHAGLDKPIPIPALSTGTNSGVEYYMYS